MKVTASLELVQNRYRKVAFLLTHKNSLFNEMRYYYFHFRVRVLAREITATRKARNVKI
jgi:hypothetical protein